VIYFPSIRAVVVGSTGLLGAIALAVAAAGHPSAAGQAGPPTAASKPAAQPSGFAGDDTCTTCHDSEGKSLHASLHGKAQNARTPAGKVNQACETCHGPGQAHAESGGDKTKIRRFTALAPRDASEVCVSCHDRGTHALWKWSTHDAPNLSCVTCHSIHSPKSAAAQLKTANVTETCATCHKTQAAKLQRSGHMPLREGKMDCTSCHNPHGSTNARMLKGRQLGQRDVRELPHGKAGAVPLGSRAGPRGVQHVP
jgi:DmsE family decaheme c-type cytochrome